MSSFTNSDHYQALNQLLQSEAESFSSSNDHVITYHCLMGMAIDFIWHHQLDVTVRDIKDIVGDVLAVELDYRQQEYQQAAHEYDTNVVDFYEYINSMAG
jgi:hypothetical protein